MRDLVEEQWVCWEADGTRIEGGGGYEVHGYVLTIKHWFHMLTNGGSGPVWCRVRAKQQRGEECHVGEYQIAWASTLGVAIPVVFFGQPPPRGHPNNRLSVELPHLHKRRRRRRRKRRRRSTICKPHATWRVSRVSWYPEAHLHHLLRKIEVVIVWENGFGVHVVRNCESVASTICVSALAVLTHIGDKDLLLSDCFVKLAMKVSGVL
jgi:hypothetical protein